MSKNTTIPGPKDPFPYIGSLRKYRKGPLAFLSGLEAQYEGVVKLRFLPIHVVFVTDPALVKEVLTMSQEKLKKGIEYEEVHHVMGLGLLTSERESWMKRRRIVQPSFYKKSIQSFGEIMVKHADIAVAKLIQQPNKSVVSLADHYTSSVFAQCIFSKDLSREGLTYTSSFAFLNKWLTKRVSNVLNWPVSFPTRDNIQFRREKRELDSFIFEMISERRRNRSNHQDLLQTFVEIKDADDGTQMTDQEVRDELVTLMIAGTESTSVTIIWLLYLITSHPEVEEKIKEELRAVFPSGEIDSTKLFTLKYCLAAIKETLRLYPPLWAFSRQARCDLNIGPYAIKKSWEIVVSPYTNHRSEKYWEAPDQFSPERFLEPALSKINHKYQYFPFGGGSRICVGEHFALLEILALMAKIYRKGRVNRPQAMKLNPVPLMTLRPDKAFEIRFISDQD